jgi:hypothetical protein
MADGIGPPADRRCNRLPKAANPLGYTPMVISPSTITAAKQRGQKELAHSALPGEPLTQVNEVVDLLATSTSPAAQPGARSLLQAMATGPWRVIRGAHRSQDDPTPHVTVVVGGVRYHLRLDARACVFDITRVVGQQTQRPAGHAPWVRPGA